MPPFPRLATAAALAAFATARVQAAAEPDTAVAATVAATAPLQTVVVTAPSRGERAALDEPVRVDVLDADALEAGQVGDLRDLERTLPNVSVPRQPARFTLAGSAIGRDGNAGLVVRGLGGNRVAMLVDGLRLPRSYSIGANAFGRDAVDFGLVERVELVRGPASALYGSDALAGVLVMRTRDPASYLTAGRRFGGQAGIAYSSDDRSWRVGATLALRAGEHFDWLLSASALHGHELGNEGGVHSADTTRTAANPQRDRAEAVLWKGVWHPAAGHRTTLTAELNERRSRYDLRSARTVQPSTAAGAVLDLDASERQSRRRLSLEHEWDAALPWLDTLRAGIGLQHSRSRQIAEEDRATAADRTRDSRYRERLQQLWLQADKAIDHGNGWSQRLTWGLDAARTRTGQFTDGVTPPAGETFPLKRFPDTSERSVALYAQDEIRHGRLTLTPGLRWDHYRLHPREDDPLYAPTPAGLSDRALSPKLAAVWRVDERWRAFGQFATGFRAPSAYQLNEFFENPLQNYRSIPNPALKPERSRGVELGVKAADTTWSFEASVFDNRYRDFIDDRVLVGGTGTSADPMVFQSVNRSRARIHGFELRGQWRVAPAWTVSGSYGRARGRDDDTGLPLNSVDPARLVVGVRHDAGRWQLGLDATHRAAKSRGDIDSTGIAAPSTLQLATAASTVLDLTGRVTLRPGLRLNAGLYNLTDRKYLEWANVQGLGNATTLADAYTAPGRSLGVSLVWDL